MTRIDQLANEIIEYNYGDIQQINHIMKVYSYAKFIGKNELLSPDNQKVLEVAALTHDFGIKVNELLKNLKFDSKLISRVCFINKHKYPYSEIDGIDFQILVEAYLLVHIYENQLSADEVMNIKENIFKTMTGIEYLNLLFCV